MRLKHAIAVGALCFAAQVNGGLQDEIGDYCTSFSEVAAPMVEHMRNQGTDEVRAQVMVSNSLYLSGMKDVVLGQRLADAIVGVVYQHDGLSTHKLVLRVEEACAGALDGYFN